MEKYVRPEAEVIEFASVDVVTTSGGDTSYTPCAPNICAPNVCNDEI